MFWPLAQARVVISDWSEDYNHRRRHSALGYQAPAVYAAAPTSERLSLNAAPMSLLQVGVAVAYRGRPVGR